MLYWTKASRFLHEFFVPQETVYCPANSKRSEKNSVDRVGGAANVHIGVASMKIPREAEIGQEPLRSLEPNPVPSRLYSSRALIRSSLIVLAMATLSSWCHGQLAFKVSGTVVKTKFAGDG